MKSRWPDRRPNEKSKSPADQIQSHWRPHRSQRRALIRVIIYNKVIRYIVNIPYVLNLLLYIYFIILIYFLGDISISLAILNSSLNKGFVVVVVLLKHGKIKKVVMSSRITNQEKHCDYVIHGYSMSIKQNMYRVKDLNLFVCFSLMFTGLPNHLPLLTVYRLMNKNIYIIKIFLLTTPPNHLCH